MTSWWGQPLQGPSGQPVPACVSSVWISFVERLAPTAIGRGAGDGMGDAARCGIVATAVAAPLEPVSMEITAAFGAGITDEAMKLGGMLFVPEPTFEAIGVAAGAGAAARAGCGSGVTTEGLPRQLL